MAFKAGLRRLAAVAKLHNASMPINERRVIRRLALLRTPFLAFTSLPTTTPAISLAATRRRRRAFSSTLHAACRPPRRRENSRRRATPRHFRCRCRRRIRPPPRQETYRGVNTHRHDDASSLASATSRVIAARREPRSAKRRAAMPTAREEKTRASEPMMMPTHFFRA